MDLELLKDKLKSHRASGVRKIPEEIWKDVAQLLLKKGIGVVGCGAWAQAESDSGHQGLG